MFNFCDREWKAKALGISITATPSAAAPKKEKVGDNVLSCELFYTFYLLQSLDMYFFPRHPFNQEHPRHDGTPGGLIGKQQQPQQQQQQLLPLQQQRDDPVTPLKAKDTNAGAAGESGGAVAKKQTSSAVKKLMRRNSFRQRNLDCLFLQLQNRNFSWLSNLSLLFKKCPFERNISCLFLLGGERLNPRRNPNPTTPSKPPAQAQWAPPLGDPCLSGTRRTKSTSGTSSWSSQSHSTPRRECQKISCGIQHSERCNFKSIFFCDFL